MINIGTLGVSELKVNNTEIGRCTTDIFLDDILITNDGYENLTTAPKTIAEMQSIANT